MYTLKKLPEEFNQLSVLEICSNKMLGGGFPFAIKEILPLIIGGGVRPQIWLQAINDFEENKSIILVDNNVSKMKDIFIFEDNTSEYLEIFRNSHKLLRIKLSSKDKAHISFLDLRPIGLNIYGNPFELNIGGSKFSNNTINGAQVFIQLG